MKDLKRNNRQTGNIINADMATFVFDKSTPNSESIEAAVLGSCLFKSENFEIVKSFLLGKEVFYSNKHRAIWFAMIELDKQGRAVDMITVAEIIKKQGLYSAYDISQITQNFTLSVANMETYCLLLLEYQVKRMVIESSLRAVKEAHNSSTDVFELVGELEEAIQRIHNITDIGQPTDLVEAAGELYDSFFDDEPDGVKTGISKLDKRLMLRKGGLYIIAGRTGHGKTALMTQFAFNQVQQEQPISVLYFSLEMKKRELIERLACNLMKFPSDKLQMFKDERQSLVKQIQKHKETDYGKQLIDQRKRLETTLSTFKEPLGQIAKMPFYIHDKSRIKVSEIKAISQKYKREKGIKAIYVDYLQLIEPDIKHQDRHVEVGYISKSLKGLAMDLDLPLIVGCQVNRQPDQRGNKIPMPSDLRESGAIEQDSDFIGFIVNPSKYDQLSIGSGETERTILNGEAVFSVQKNRNGPDMEFVLQAGYSHYRFWSEDE